MHRLRAVVTVTRNKGEPRCYLHPMTRNDLQLLSHFLRRVVTHDPTEIQHLWRLVTMIESALSVPSDSTRQMETASK